MPETYFAPYHPFECVKAPAPILVTSALVYDALVLAALDPEVVRVEPVPFAEVLGRVVRLDAVAVTRAGRRLVLDVIDPARPADIDAGGLALAGIAALGLHRLTLTAAEVRQEPRHSNARLVWSCRDRIVDPETRLRILSALGGGPLPLAEAAAAAGGIDSAPVEAVCALACADLVGVDLARAPLGPETVVRRISRKG